MNLSYHLESVLVRQPRINHRRRKDLPLSQTLIDRCDPLDGRSTRRNLRATGSKHRRQRFATSLVVVHDEHHSSTL